MKQLTDIPFSILDLAPIVEGGSASQAFNNSLELAKHVENLGYLRFWVAEHHNMPGIASSATSVLIAYLAGGTSTIRIGSGGIMLPNHAPLLIAEQFGTLEAMYPGRIDLGVGRAPGSDQITAMALRRDARSAHDFPEQLEELRSYFASFDETNRSVRAIPGEGANIPIWLLGSSGFSAQLAAELGLPFAFASHFSPEFTLPALKLYRNNFQPSEHLQRPHTMAGVNIIVADTNEEAIWLASSQQQSFLNLIRGRPTQLKPPVETMDTLWNEHEKLAIEKQLKTTFTGSPEVVKAKLQAFIEETDVDEIIVNTMVYDHHKRLHSYTRLREIIS